MSDQMYSNLKLLKDHDLITDEEWTGIEAVKDNTTILSILWGNYSTQYEQLNKQMEVEKAKNDAFFNAHEKVEGDADKCGEATTLLKKLGYIASYSMFKDRDTGEKSYAVKLDAGATAYILQLVLADKAKAEAKYVEDHKPKPTKKKSGGKKSKFEGEVKYVNTPEDPEGKDNPFYFKGDENQVYTKPTFTAKDGSYQNVKYKAVKSDRYLGGAESKPDDGKCNGVVIWDRAVASNAIAETGISPAKFKVRCDTNATTDGYCSKCYGKGSNFFTSVYDLGKNAKGSIHNGTTY